MVKVVMGKDANDVDTLLRKWKTKVKKSGIIDECRKREYFLKKSLARKRKSEMARKNKRK